MYVGPVGSGKTYNAVAHAVEDAGDLITTNTPIVETRLTEWLADNAALSARLFALADGTTGEFRKYVVQWSAFNDEVAIGARCGVLLIDEAPLWLDARKFDMLSGDARRKIIEHRKDDLVIISTAQDVAFIDKVFRLLCDEIRLVRQVSFPIIGWIWPTCKRPTIVCAKCGRVRRDGHGDDRGWRRVLGFGTFYTWTTFKAKDLIDAQDTSGEAAEAKSIGGGWRRFDIRVASLYDTSKKLSGVAKAAIGGGRGHKGALAPVAAPPEALPI